MLCCVVLCCVVVVVVVVQPWLLSVGAVAVDRFSFLWVIVVILFCHWGNNTVQREHAFGKFLIEGLRLGTESCTVLDGVTHFVQT